MSAFTISMEKQIQLDRVYLTIAEWNRKLSTNMPDHHPGKFSFSQLQVFMNLTYGNIRYKSILENKSTHEPNPEYQKWYTESHSNYFGIESLDQLKDRDFISDINEKYPGEDIAEKCREITVWFAKYGNKMPPKTITKNNYEGKQDYKCPEMQEFDKACANMKRLIGI